MSESETFWSGREVWQFFDMSNGVKPLAEISKSIQKNENYYQVFWRGYNEYKIVYSSPELWRWMRFV